MKTTNEIVNDAINELGQLTNDDFHGYRSEVFRVVMSAMREQDRDTRHACARAVAELPLCTTSNNDAIYDSKGEIVQAISLTDAHSTCMNVKAIF